jgi:hypothetical protein
MKSSNNQIVAKIYALLSTADSHDYNQNEAKNAAYLAVRLIIKYQLKITGSVSQEVKNRISTLMEVACSMSTDPDRQASLSAAKLIKEHNLSVVEPTAKPRMSSQDLYATLQAKVNSLIVNMRKIEASGNNARISINRSTLPRLIKDGIVAREDENRARSYLKMICKTHPELVGVRGRRGGYFLAQEEAQQAA